MTNTVSLNKEIHNQLRKLSQLTRLPMSQIIEILIMNTNTDKIFDGQKKYYTKLNEESKKSKTSQKLYEVGYNLIKDENENDLEADIKYYSKYGEYDRDDYDGDDEEWIRDEKIADPRFREEVIMA